MLGYSAWPCALPGSVTSGSRCAGRRSARHQDGLADRGPGLDRRVRFGGLGQRENLADRRAQAPGSRESESLLDERPVVLGGADHGVARDELDAAADYSSPGWAAQVRAVTGTLDVVFDGVG